MRACISPICCWKELAITSSFAGIDNPLYYLDRTLMLFGDAKTFVGEIVRELAGSGHR
jgi:NAD(P) transhydrogenase subunit beta